VEPIQVFTRDRSGTGPDRIRYWTCKTAGPVLDPFRTGSRTVPCKQKIRSGPVPCKHSLKSCLCVCLTNFKSRRLFRSHLPHYNRLHRREGPTSFPWSFAIQHGSGSGASRRLCQRPRERDWRRLGLSTA